METLIIDPVLELKRLLKIDLKKIQNYDVRYSQQDQETYAYVVDKLLNVWEGRVHPEIIKGAEYLGIREKRIPHADILSIRLKERSGMGYFYSEDVTPDPVLFAGYKRCVFPTTVYIRPPEEKDYTPKPDLVHEDTPGHGAALSIIPYAHVVQKVGTIVEAFRFHPLVMEIMDFVHWYFVEFPLLLTKDDKLQIVGPGILSSPKECVHAIEGENVCHHEINIENAFDVFDHACTTKKEIFHLQNDLWVFRSFHDFKELLNVKLPEYLREKTGILPLPY